jgi:hypothetical protein
MALSRCLRCRSQPFVMYLPASQQVWVVVPKAEDNLSQLREVSPSMSDSDATQSMSHFYLRPSSAHFRRRYDDIRAFQVCINPECEQQPEPQGRLSSSRNLAEKVSESARRGVGSGKTTQATLLPSSRKAP